MSLPGRFLRPIFRPLSTAPIHSLLNEAVKDYSTILLTRMIRKVSALKGSLDFSRYELEQLKNSAYEKTREILLKDLTNAEKIAFVNHWNSPFHQGISQKLKDYDGQNWLPLFDQKEIAIPVSVVGKEGWKFITRTTPTELLLEAKKLNHCVESYSSKCLTKNSHVVSVVDAKGDPVSTIEFSTMNDCLTALQHRGANDGEAFGPPQKALDWLMQEVRNESIKIDYENINAIRIENKAVQAVGLNPHNDEKFQTMVGVYTHQMLPSGKFAIKQLTKNFRDFLDAIEVETYNHKLLLEPTKEELPMYKLRVSIANTVKICGKEVNSFVTPDQVFFSSKNPEALSKLKMLFEGKYQQSENAILVRGDPQEVRRILTRKAIDERTERRKGEEEPRSVVYHPTSEACRGGPVCPPVYKA